MLLGRWKQDEALSIQSVSAVTIRSRKPRLQVMIDGEIESMAVPLVFRIRPSALQVLAHPDADDRLVAQTGK
jgi:diacylglycerol kinase family enzyme